MITALSTVLLLSIFPQAASADDSEPKFSGSADLGITLISGNTESANSAINLGLNYVVNVHKFDFGLHYQAVRDTDQATDIATTSSRLYRSNLQYNFFLSADKETYVWTNIATRQDEPTGLLSRNNLGAGFGYYMLLGKALNFNVEIGASYVDEEKVSAASEATVGRLAFHLKWPASDNLLLISSSEFLSSSDIETYGQDLSLRYSLNTDWYLQLANNISYDAFPSAGSETTDSRWDITIGTSF
jgi:putative salt-induced outer membrane protein YdiY